MRNSFSLKATFCLIQLRRVRSNAIQDISFESTYCNIQDKWHVKKITLDAR